MLKRNPIPIKRIPKKTPIKPVKGKDDLFAPFPNHSMDPIDRITSSMDPVGVETTSSMDPVGVETTLSNDPVGVETTLSKVKVTKNSPFDFGTSPLKKPVKSGHKNSIKPVSKSIGKPFGNPVDNPVKSSDKPSRKINTLTSSPILKKPKINLTKTAKSIDVKRDKTQSKYVVKRDKSKSIEIATRDKTELSTNLEKSPLLKSTGKRRHDSDSLDSESSSPIPSRKRPLDMVFSMPSKLEHKFASSPSKEYEPLPSSQSSLSQRVNGCPVQSCESIVPLPYSTLLQEAIDHHDLVKGQYQLSQVRRDTLLFARNRVCEIHRGELETVPNGIKAGYPTTIDFQTIPSRVLSLKPILDEIIAGNIHSSYRDQMMTSYQVSGRKAQGFIVQW